MAKPFATWRQWQPGMSAPHMSNSPGETVAYAADGVNVAGILRVVFELLAQPGDMHIDGAGGDAGLILPYGLQQFVARDHVAPALDEIAQKLEFLGRQV